MIAAPTSMAQAVAELDRALQRVDEYRAQLDHSMDLLQKATQLSSRLGVEIREYQKELETRRGELEEARQIIVRLRNIIDTITADRDNWRAKANAAGLR
jgi:chromosome segregation ATPase